MLKLNFFLIFAEHFAFSFLYIGYKDANQILGKFYSFNRSKNSFYLPEFPPYSRHKTFLEHRTT